jgi:hypothetical protein
VYSQSVLGSGGQRGWTAAAITPERATDDRGGHTGFWGGRGGWPLLRSKKNHVRVGSNINNGAVKLIKAEATTSGAINLEVNRRSPIMVEEERDVVGEPMPGSIQKKEREPKQKQKQKKEAKRR